MGDEDSKMATDTRNLNTIAKELLKDKHIGSVFTTQPTNHPNDPLAWSWRKKHITLFTISLISFLAKFGASIGIPAAIPQAQ